MLQITKEQSDIVRLFNLATLSAALGVFGIVSNIINMIVFHKQGFTTTINISLFALALSDLLCLLTAEWFCICLNPFFESADILFIPIETQYLTGGWVHVCLGRVTSWITVYITAERCLSVALPLKIKQIVSTRKTTACMCLIFAINLIMLIPEYCIAYLDWKFIPARNKTLVGLMYRSNKYHVYGLVFALTSSSGILSFVSVIFLTAFLVAKLSHQSNWHLKVSGVTDQSNTRMIRDNKIIKMVVIIASILIVCYIPGTLMSLVTVFQPDFMIGNKNENLCFAFWSVAFVFDAFNSSINMLLYYNMSSKYRETFTQLFAHCPFARSHCVVSDE